MADTALEWVSEEALDALLAQPGAALVVFMVQWCSPCKVLAPRLEKLASRHQSKMSCHCIDADRYPEPAQKYGVRGLPTLVLFVDGDLEATRVGALDEEQLESFVASTL